jgi:CrcB protein
MKNILLVLVAGAVGSLARYLVSTYANRALQIGAMFPIGTLAVNLIGSFLAGLVFGLTIDSANQKTWRILLITGFMGGFTTFSAYALDSYQLANAGDIKGFATNILANNVLGLVLCFAGILLARVVVKAIRG